MSDIVPPLVFTLFVLMSIPYTKETVEKMQIVTMETVTQWICV